jgi:ABC-type Na+ efflux pump permease subunit
MFAAIGSAMGDDMGEGQALTLPAMIPLILAFYIVFMAGLRNPDSSLMVFASIFPLFSPIAMPFRLAFNPALVAGGLVDYLGHWIGHFLRLAGWPHLPRGDFDVRQKGNREGNVEMDLL